MKRTSSPGLLALVAGICLLAAGCAEQIRVTYETVVFFEGALDRGIEIVGSKGDGEPPKANSWFARDAGVELAFPDRWSRVERDPSSIRASGHFNSIEFLPPTLAAVIDGKTYPDGHEASLTIEDREIARRWVYRERHHDPFDALQMASALQALVDLFSERLEEELLAEFGDSFDSRGLQRFVLQDIFELAQAGAQIRRLRSGSSRATERESFYRQMLSQRGIRTEATSGSQSTAGAEDDETLFFWEQHFPAILDWGRSRLAERLSDDERIISPEQLRFWPHGEDWQLQLEELVQRGWGDSDALFEEIEPHLIALGGQYARDQTPRFRFVHRLQLPGQLLRTNGTVNGDEITFFYRETDLALNGFTMEASSLALDREALVALGARTDLNLEEQLQLEDILWNEDRDGELAKLLAQAVQEKSLDVLIEDAVEGTLRVLATELYRLLEAD